MHNEITTNVNHFEPGPANYDSAYSMMILDRRQVEKILNQVHIHFNLLWQVPAATIHM